MNPQRRMPLGPWTASVCFVLAACGADTDSRDDAGGADDAQSDAADVDGDGADAVADAADAGSDAADAMDADPDSADAGGDVASDADASGETGPDATQDADASTDADPGDAFEPLPDGCVVTRIDPATFAVGDTPELSVELFCPETSGARPKPSFAILLGGGGGSFVERSSESVAGGVVFRDTVRFGDVVLTRDNIGRLELSVLGAPDAAPIESSIGVAEDIGTLAALDDAPQPGVQLDGAAVALWAAGFTGEERAAAALVVGTDGVARFYRRGSGGAVEATPASSRLLGFWNFEDTAAQDTSGLIAPVGGVNQAAPMATLAVAGCAVESGALNCGVLPVAADGLGETIAFAAPAGMTVDRILDVLPVAPAGTEAGSFGELEVLAVGTSARGVPGVWRIAVGPAAAVPERVTMPTTVDAALIGGSGTARLVRITRTAAEGPETPTRAEIWSCTPGRVEGSTTLTAGRWSTATGTFETRFSLSGCGDWGRGAVTTVRDGAGALGHVVSDSFAGGHALRYFPPGSDGSDVVELALPPAIADAMRYSDAGLPGGGVQVRGDAHTGFAIRAALDIAYSDLLGDSVTGVAVLDWMVPGDLTGVGAVTPTVALLSLPTRASGGVSPAVETLLTASGPPRVAVPVGDGTVWLDSDRPQGSCGDACRAKVRDVVCGDTDHFLTAGVGGTATAVSWTVLEDGETEHPLPLPEGARIAAVPSNCVVDREGNGWLVAQGTRGAPGGDVDGLVAWQFAFGGARPRGPVWIDLGGPIRGSRLLDPTQGAEPGVAELVYAEAGSSEARVRSLAIDEVAARFGEGATALRIDELGSSASRPLLFEGTPVVGPPQAVPGAMYRAAEGERGPASWFWRFVVPGDGACSIVIRGGDVIFSDSSTFDVRESTASCGGSLGAMIAGNFGTFTGPVRVDAATRDRGVRVTTTRFGGDTSDEVVVELDGLTGAGGGFPRVVAADFNGDGLSDLFFASTDTSSSGVLFADGNGGWLRDELTHVPALTDLQDVLSAQPGLAGGSVYGAEGLRIRSLRRSTRSSDD